MVVDRIVASCRERGVAVLEVRERPGVIPRRLMAPLEGGARKGRIVSVALLVLLCADYVLASAGRWRRMRRKGMVVVEGGWYETLTRPDRYGFAPFVNRLCWILGRFVPPADVAVLVGTGASDAAAPGEGSVEDWAWPALAPWAGRRVLIIDSAEANVWDLLDRLLARRDDREAPPLRWAAAPLAPGRDVRATVGPGVHSGFVHVAQRKNPSPMWLVNSALLERGLAIPTFPPMAGLAELCRMLEIKPDGMVSVRTGSGYRIFVGVSVDGELRVVLKTGGADDEGLAREAEMLGRIRAASTAVPAPGLLWSGLWHGRMVIATEAVAARGDGTALVPDQVIDLAVGLARRGEDLGPIVHGDLAPWNVLSTRNGFVLVDWERSRLGTDPLYDLAHFVTQQGSVVGRFGPREAIATLTAPGSPGWRYLEALDIAPSTAPDLVVSYLQRTSSFGLEGRPRRYREEMLQLATTLASG